MQATGNPKQTWNNNNEINLKEIIYKGLKWTKLVHDHVQLLITALYSLQNTSATSNLNA
jgi:hypothetical protein